MTTKLYLRKQVDEVSSRLRNAVNSGLMGILPVVVGSYEELETTKAVNEKLDEKDKLCIDGNPPNDGKKCPEGQRYLNTLMPVFTMVKVGFPLYGF